jgi:RES domain
LALETQVPPQPIYRVGRQPDAWQAPDWSRSSRSDGTFGNRFDDPESYYRVLYASSQEVSCFIETLARFRPDLTLLAELKAIEGEDDFFPLGEVPPDWCANRVMGTASAEGNYAEICAGEWITHLRRKLASECLRLGIKDLDASVLQSGSPRHITQLASRVVYELRFPGIYFLSRYAHDLENWALFEPFRIRDTASKPIANDHPALREAVHILGLKLA